MAEYKTVRKNAQDQFVEKRSRFIGYACPVQTEQEALDFITSKKSEHWDASHNVYAYILRDGTMRFSDDGEPQGTAGMPVLDVLRKSGVTDVVTVATRYFGGILLGAGGLVRAYAKSAAMAVEASGISVRRIWQAVDIPCPYNLFERVRQEIDRCGGMIADTEYGAEVLLRAVIPQAHTEPFLKRLTDLSSGHLQPLLGGQEYRAVPIQK